MKDFENLPIWKYAIDFSIKIYSSFITCKDYGFKDQIQRSSVSISNNIAEGYDKKSDKELRRYLLIARGSAAETRSMIVLARKLNYINESDYVNLYDKCREISKMLTGFIKYLSVV